MAANPKSKPTKSLTVEDIQAMLDEYTKDCQDLEEAKAAFAQEKNQIRIDTEARLKGLADQALKHEMGVLLRKAIFGLPTEELERVGLLSQLAQKAELDLMEHIALEVKSRQRDAMHSLRQGWMGMRPPY